MPGKFKRADMWQVFAISALPINIWAVLKMLVHFPSWMLSYDLGDLVGLVSYVLTIALLDTLIVFAVVCLFWILVPWSWFQDRFVLIANLFALTLSGYAIVLVKDDSYFGLIRLLPHLLIATFAAWWGIVSLISLSPKLRQMAASLFDRLALLSSIYLVFNFIGLAVVLIRNIF